LWIKLSIWVQILHVYDTMRNNTWNFISSPPIRLHATLLMRKYIFKTTCSSRCQCVSCFSALVSSFIAPSLDLHCHERFFLSLSNDSHLFPAHKTKADRLKLRSPGHRHIAPSSGKPNTRQYRITMRLFTLTLMDTKKTVSKHKNTSIHMYFCVLRSDCLLEFQEQRC